MYHIKADRRCRNSAERISSAYGELLTKKPLSDITVSDIQRESGVGRSTFYRLFDNTDDVLCYLTEEAFHDIARLYDSMELRDFTEYFITSLVSESRELINIVSSGKMYIISNALRANLTREAEAGHYRFDNISKYTIATFVGCCISIVTAWDEDGRQESIKELADLMREFLDFKKMESNLKRPVSK